MDFMRCRSIVKENGVKNIVWFGSYGKTVIAQAMEGTITNNTFQISGTSDGQEYSITFNAINDTSIEFYSAQDGSFIIQVNEGQTYISGYLPYAIDEIRLTLSDFDENTPIMLTIYELSISKKSNDKIPQVERNFSEDQNGIAADLTQKLSVMRGELWHNISFGLPLLEKIRSKALIDSAVADIILQQENVTGISKFVSVIKEKEYHAEIEVQTDIGNLEINI